MKPAPAEAGDDGGTAGERRQGDRRRNDRRGQIGNRGRRSDDSLFGALGDADSQSAESLFDPGWLAAGDAAVAADSRLLLRQARRVAQQQDSALARVFRTYAAARAVIGVGLVASQAFTTLFVGRGHEWVALLCVVYGVQAITLWLLPRFGSLALPQPSLPRRVRQWLATVGVDLVAFSLLHVAARRN